MKNLRLSEISRKNKEMELLDFKMLKRVIGGKQIAGCCNGMCQDCSDGTWRSEDTTDNTNTPGYQS